MLLGFIVILYLFFVINVKLAKTIAKDKNIGKQIVS